MRYRKYILFLVFVLLTASVHPASGQSSYTISKNTIAGLQITRETTVADLYKAFGEENVKMGYTTPEGSRVPTVFVYFGETPSIDGLIDSIDLSAKLQYGLAVYDSRFVTDQGIRVGSTVGDLKRKYVIKEVVTGEAGRKFAICDEAQMSFELKAYWGMRSGSIENIPEDVPIILIYVWPVQPDRN